MKKIVIVLLCLIAVAGYSYTTILVSDVSFYKVNLVCNAAPDIGCGSRAKLVLIDLKKQESTKEAWLNRTGTIVAVVWKEKSEINNSKLVSNIFSKHQLSYEEVKDEAREALVANFKSGEEWYEGKEVDKLSIEEAGRIADRIVKVLIENKMLPENKSSAMRDDLRIFYEQELLNVEDASYYTSQECEEKWINTITEIGEKYVGKGNMKYRELLKAADAEKGNKETECNKDKSACCAKKGSN
jgi:hypothetical protein